MATIGQKLASPEEGWKRIDNNYSMITYTGTWTTETLASNYGGSATYTSTNGATANFTFYGTKLRIIGGLYPGRTTNAQVIVDGVVKGTMNEDGVATPQALVFDISGLTPSNHTVQLKTQDTKVFIFDAIDIDSTGYLLGPLTNPESGWKRYDDTDPAIKRIGTWASSATHTGYWGSNAMYSTYEGDKIIFCFRGTKIRIITQNDDLFPNNVPITIDGVTETFSEWQAATTSTFRNLVYEKSGLSDGVHTVEITVPAGNLATHIDAVDIDSTGRLLHPDEVMELNDLTIGKRIRFNYVTTSGNIGVLSNIGQETNSFIPVASTTIPNGDAYLIMVDSDSNGRRILVADRNIQHTITYDTLNTFGISNTASNIFETMLPMTSYTSTVATVSASSEFDTTSYQAWKAFDNSATTYWTTTSQTATTEALLNITYVNPTIVNQYTLHAKYGPKKWQLEASSDNLNWVNLHTGNEATAWNDTKKSYSFENTTKYKYYRIRVTERHVWNSSYYYTGFYNVQLSRKDSILSIRLLTGGISSSDKNNEWDNYIVNSTLNGTISAGDNTIWNWNAVYSWTSTVDSTKPTYRTSRGNTASNTWMSYTTAAAGSNLGFRPVIIVEDLSIKRYLFKDADGFKRYNGSSWDIVTTTTPTESDFANNGMDSLGLINQGNLDLLKVPYEVIVWTQNNADSLSIDVSGYRKVEYKYKVEMLEPYSLLADWSSLLNVDVNGSVTIPSSSFTSAVNPYTIQVTAEQTDNVSVNSQGTLTLYDTEPTLIATITGLTLNIDVGDEENNKVQFKYSLNGTQIYPESGFTQLTQSPINHSVTFSSRDILIGQQNNIEVVARDEYGKESIVNLNFIGKYSGMMFADERDQYYSTDLGEILQLLDLGVIIAGQITIPVPVKLKNMNGFSVTNIVLTKNVGTLPNGILLEFSKTESPFVPEDSLAFDSILNYNEEVMFYVRLTSNKDAMPHNGDFEFEVNANPVS